MRILKNTGKYLMLSFEEEEELQVSIFMYEGQQYLIDDLNNVYDFTSQDKIGSLINDIIVKST